MSYIQQKALIVKKEELAQGIFRYTLKNSELVSLSRAGQFVHILCGEKTLRRPISICSIDKENGVFDIVFSAKGEGTHWMSGQNKGDEYDVLGPLGNGFDTDIKGRVLLIGGGIGVPPMLCVASEILAPCDAILGFGSKDAVILEKDFKAVCSNVHITTDDGSFGRKGLVTDLLSEIADRQKYSVIYACGPAPMLKAVAMIAEKNKIKCCVSLEERMGCGVGACLVCACKTKHGNIEQFSHVCKDGPVFNAQEVVW
ncbi:MAG: dihydroorotate dehydrogenase electron transfer subunit [Oscillospiraceae bacterium]|nr:dihydroorotate dehydrogenase electron transfer subunit [Oscillospiraceae bacterium]